ncbi:MAG: hypothetical protein CTY37_02860 [Methylotenera sp.]|nr:MAG: hypothetical protein CTY37_02860 [Methylotenera sp.]
MKKLWDWYKKLSMWLGMVMIPLIIMSLFASDWTINAMESTNNIFDDALYYAYNAEKFGWIAEIWRFVTIYAVYFLAKTMVIKAMELIKTKIIKPPKAI